MPVCFYCRGPATCSNLGAYFCRQHAPKFSRPVRERRGGGRFRGIVCRHCGRRPAHMSRGLCHPCYGDLDIRAQYATLSLSGNRHPDDDGPEGEDVPAPVPTPHPPGSPEKVAVLVERAEKRVGLWSPLDAGWPAWEGREEQPKTERVAV